MHYPRYIENLKRNKTFINGVLFSVFAFAGRGISFLLLVILANYIPPSDYGKLSLFNTVVMLLGFFMAFSSYGYFDISYFKESKEIFRRDFTSINYLLFLSTIIISAIFFLFDSYISSIVGIESNLLWVALIVSFLHVPFQMHMEYFRFKEKIWHYGGLNVSNAVFNAVVTILLVVTFSQGWLGRVNTQLWVTLFYAIVAIVFFTCLGLWDFHIDTRRIKLLLLWGVPQIPHLATNWLRQGCDQYFINYFYTKEDVGLFSFALNLASVITMIGLAFNSSNSVTIFKILSDKTIHDTLKQLQKNTKDIFIVYLVAIFLVIFSVIVVVPLLMPMYVGSMPYFLILALYGFMTCIYFLYCNYLFYYEKTRNLMYITFGTSALHFVLSFILTRYSLYCTACIYFVSQSLCVMLVYLKSKKIIQTKLINEMV